MSKTHVLVTTLAFAGLVACSSDGPTTTDNQRAVATITISPTTVLLGDTAHMSIVARDSSGAIVETDAPVWASLDSSIVVISPEGVASGVSPGNAYVVATAGGKTGNARMGTALAFEKISANYFHACGLTAEGKAYCWGDNAGGQHGNGAPDNLAHPIARPVNTDLRFKDITTGDYHTCALTTTGQAYCWGVNFFGHLGAGFADEFAYIEPQAVAGSNTYASISAGRHFTCALTDGGAVHCWGDNFKGQTGDSVNTDCVYPEGSFSCTLTPNVVAAVSLASLDAGQAHACGVSGAGEAWCWGADTLGALGRGASDQAAHFEPTLVTGDHHFTSVSAGYFHSCGIADGGVVYCWGSNDAGELGRDSYQAGSANPTPLAVAGATTWSEVNAAAYHSCGVSTDGDGYCWGWADGGQLGSLGPDQCAHDQLFERCALSPVIVPGGLDFESIEGAILATCGVGPRSGVYCWGVNDFGILGDGTVSSRFDPRLASSGGAGSAPSGGASMRISARLNGAASPLLQRLRVRVPRR